MQSEQVNSSIIVNELQLGQSLNKAVGSGESAKFAYLLSMLSDDVIDQPQFHFTSFGDSEPNLDDTQLRLALSLPPEAPLFNDDETMLRAERQSRMFSQGSMADVRLLNALAPTALVAKREGDNALPKEIIEILPHWKRADAQSKPEYSSIEPMVDLLNQLNRGQTTSL